MITYAENAYSRLKLGDMLACEVDWIKKVDPCYD